jgi:hypothetical protein
MDSYSNDEEEEEDFYLNLSLPMFVSYQHHVLGEVIAVRGEMSSDDDKYT